MQLPVFPPGAIATVWIPLQCRGWQLNGVVNYYCNLLK